MRFYIGFSTSVFLVLISIVTVIDISSSQHNAQSWAARDQKARDADKWGYIQEIALYDTLDETGNYLYFRTNVPDTSSYRHYLKNVKRVCFRGRWDAYSLKNYENKSAIFDSWNRACFNQTFEHQSFRHMAAGNVSRSAISLYAGEEFTGREYFVNGHSDLDANVNPKGQFEYSGIQEPIRSFALSGHLSDRWQLFEGTHFNGSSACARKLHIVLIDSIRENLIHQLYNLTTIGSVRKNCSEDVLPKH